MPKSDAALAVYEEVSFILSEAQSTPPRRMFLMDLSMGIPVENGTLYGWAAFADVLAIRAVTQVTCRFNFGPTDRRVVQTPASIEQARQDGWAIGEPTTKVLAIVLNEDVGQLRVSREDETYIIPRWPETEDADRLSEIAGRLLRERAEGNEYDPNKLVIDVRFQGDGQPRPD